MKLLAVAAIVALASDDPMPVMTPYSPIAAMVQAVDANRLRADVERLVAFGTRNDFSEQTSTHAHGVFAARDWIAQRFREIAATADGRMSVSLDTYVQPKTPRPRARYWNRA